MKKIPSSLSNILNKRVPRVYCICRINKKYWTTINKDLKKHHFNNLQAIVPIVKVIRKNKLGKEILVEIPMLFSYGFVKMPINLAYDRPFLNKVRKAIPGIQSWVRSTSPMFAKRVMKRIDNAEDFDDFSQLAIIPKDEMDRLLEMAKKNPIFSKEDMVNLNIGDTITIKSYPFKGALAEVLEVNLSQRRVKVNIYPDSNFSMTASLPFDNVLYSVYDEYDDSYIDENPISISTQVLNQLPDQAEEPDFEL